MKKVINEILKVIESNNDIALVSHINPDGDNLGSMIALYKSLQIYGKNAFFYTDDNYPDNLKFLPFLEEKTIDYPKELDILICLDSSDTKRLGKRAELLKIAKQVIVIDHHKSSDFYGDINYIVEDASSTGELVYNLILEGNLPINKEIANLLYVAIATDTGNFQYSCTHSSTFRVAADLMDLGIDFEMINNELYEKMKMSELKLISKALSRMTFSHDNKVAMTYVTLKDYEELNSKYTEADNIVSFLRGIDTVEIGVILKERESSFNVSIRTKTMADASKIAKNIGGGGHIRAAGANIPTHDIKEAMKKITDSINKELKDEWNLAD